MEVKYYVCNHCGNIIEMVKDKGVPVICCGEAMHEPDTDVRNTQGTIEGRDRTTVYAKNDVINEGGTIKQTDEKGKLVMAADRDVINNGVKYEASNSKVVWNSANSRRETVTAVDQGQITAKGDAVTTGVPVSLIAASFSLASATVAHCVRIHGMNSNCATWLTSVSSSGKASSYAALPTKLRPAIPRPFSLTAS